MMLPLHNGQAMRAIRPNLSAWAFGGLTGWSIPASPGYLRGGNVSFSWRAARKTPVLCSSVTTPECARTHSYNEDSYGFYWTEGLRGLGWCRDGVPTLKGGSTIGIPSAPAVWIPGGSTWISIRDTRNCHVGAAPGIPQGMDRGSLKSGER